MQKTFDSYHGTIANDKNRSFFFNFNSILHLNRGTTRDAKFQ